MIHFYKCQNSIFLHNTFSNELLFISVETMLYTIGKLCIKFTLKDQYDPVLKCLFDFLKININRFSVREMTMTIRWSVYFVENALRTAWHNSWTVTQVLILLSRGEIAFCIVRCKYISFFANHCFCQKVDLDRFSIWK